MIYFIGLSENSLTSLNTWGPNNLSAKSNKTKPSLVLTTPTFPKAPIK